MTFKEWKLLSIDEAKEIIKNIANNEKFIEKITINAKDGYKLFYFNDANTVRKRAEVIGKYSGLYSEASVNKLIIEFLIKEADEIAEWLVNGLTYKCFKYNAGHYVGYIVNDKGTRQETSVLNFHLSKDTNYVGKIGFMIDMISPTI